MSISTEEKLPLLTNTSPFVFQNHLQEEQKVDELPGHLTKLWYTNPHAAGLHPRVDVMVAVQKILQSHKCPEVKQNKTKQKKKKFKKKKKTKQNKTKQKITKQKK